jgi:hypothetical protein
MVISFPEKAFSTYKFIGNLSINFSFKIANLPAPLNPEHWYNR